jgi:hypothetical protein
VDSRNSVRNRSRLTNCYLAGNSGACQATRQWHEELRRLLNELKKLENELES